MVNYYSDKEGKFIFNINQTDKTFTSVNRQRHEQILKFLETKDAVDLQNIIGGKLVKWNFVFILSYVNHNVVHRVNLEFYHEHIYII